MKTVFFLIIAFISSISCYSQSSTSYVYSGLLKAKQNDYQGAIADYNKALELDPKEARAYLTEGWQN